MTDSIDPQELEALAWNNNRDYSSPIPAERDRQIGQLVEKLRRLEPFQLTEMLAKGYDGALIVYAQRMASLAVRQRSRVILNSGIAAAGIAGSVPQVDFRDVIPVHTLLWHSAELLGLDARHEFLTVAEELDGEGGRLLAVFTTRSPEDRSLGVMRYEEGEDDDGFVYRRVPRK